MIDAAPCLLLTGPQAACQVQHPQPWSWSLQAADFNSLTNSIASSASTLQAQLYSVQAQQQAQIDALGAGLQQLNGSLAVLASQQTSDVTALNSTISATAANLATTAAALQSQISSLSASQQSMVAGLQQNLSAASAALQSSISGVGLQLAHALQSLREASAALHSGLHELAFAAAATALVATPACQSMHATVRGPCMAVSWWSQAGTRRTCINRPQLRGTPQLGSCQLLPSLLHLEQTPKAPTT